jgi:hypothetical protein
LTAALSHHHHQQNQQLQSHHSFQLSAAFPLSSSSSVAYSVSPAAVAEAFTTATTSTIGNLPEVSTADHTGFLFAPCYPLASPQEVTAKRLKLCSLEPSSFSTSLGSTVVKSAAAAAAHLNLLNQNENLLLAHQQQQQQNILKMAASPIVQGGLNRSGGGLRFGESVCIEWLKRISSKEKFPI